MDVCSRYRRKRPPPPSGKPRLDVCRHYRRKRPAPSTPPPRMDVCVHLRSRRLPMLAPASPCRDRDRSRTEDHLDRSRRHPDPASSGPCATGRLTRGRSRNPADPDRAPNDRAGGPPAPPSTQPAQRSPAPRRAPPPARSGIRRTARHELTIRSDPTRSAASTAIRLPTIDSTSIAAVQHTDEFENNTAADSVCRRPAGCTTMSSMTRSTASADPKRTVACRPNARARPGATSCRTRRRCRPPRACLRARTRSSGTSRARLLRAVRPLPAPRARRRTACRRRSGSRLSGLRRTDRSRRFASAGGCCHQPILILPEKLGVR